MCKPVHECRCADCQQAQPHPNQALHRQMNAVLARLDEQQRRWIAGLEAIRLGHGGIRTVTQITGLDAKTVSRGWQEVATELQGRPQGRVRLPGGGRPRTEKKPVTSSSVSTPNSKIKLAVTR